MSAAATTQPKPSGYHPANGTDRGYAKRAGVPAHARHEGPLARAIEEQTSKLPSDVFLWAAGASMAASATAKVMGSKNTALFIGQWAAPFLILGLYNKLVKLEGSE
ncbi:hypothetical protein [Alienimonas chondri]|uniref:Uncharacterized protein n=1 Tax=Alienimonas chondri TaxID=2681879 RepID=A0ABX1VEI7_9PLAN|nr:hypothetical protein [Alienimonas chondri]NNJ26396.1 hypothetical protein [Alienimonas chondri]